MKSATYKLNRPTENSLERVIEPLANYISAANRPRAALISALAVLCRVVEETNIAANAHLANYWENN